MPSVPLTRLVLGDDEVEAVRRVLASGHVTQGPEVRAFEDEFAPVVGGRACVAVNSGTAALHLGLLSQGVGQGDEVVVPSFSFAATANAVALTGARPVFADIDEQSFCLDPASVESVTTSRTVAVMPVHLFGHPADMTRLVQVAERRGLMVFEDAAQAHGAVWRGRQVGTFGRFAAFSFYATKNISAGEGGMIALDDEAHRRSVELLRNQGMIERYQHEVVGFNARMTDLHAAIGRVQLSRLADITDRRRRNAEHLLGGLAGVAGITVPTVHPGASPVWHQFTIRVHSGRDEFAQALRREHGVESGVYYPVPLHRSKAHAASTEHGVDLPVTDAAAREVLSLPVHPALTPHDLDRVVDAVRVVAGAGR